MVVQKEIFTQATLPFFGEDADATESILENGITVDKADRESKKDTTSTFSDNLSLPIHRWFRYSAGFKSYIFEKTRDRNVKWKNRKHTVPLHEGRLWIEG